MGNETDAYGWLKLIVYLEKLFFYLLFGTWNQGFGACTFRFFESIDRSIYAWNGTLGGRMTVK